MAGKTIARLDAHREKLIKRGAGEGYRKWQEEGFDQRLRKS